MFVHGTASIRFLARRFIIALISLCSLNGVSVFADEAADTELLRKIAERDKVIENLERRLQVLESKMLGNTNPPQIAITSPSQVADAPAAPTSKESVELEEEATRALERTLVREGGIVLPVKAFEIEPRFSYDHRTSNMLEIDDTAGAAQIVQRDFKRDAFEMGVGVRVGLPWGTQLEAYVPYGITRVQSANVGDSQDTDRTEGVGNIELGLTKQILNEKGSVPALLGSVRWRDKSSAGGNGTLSGVGNDFSSTQAALTAVKRLDPLVFLGSLSYTVNHSDTISGVRIDPGDWLGLRLASILAISPSTSLQFGIDLVRGNEAKALGRHIAGSDVSYAVLDVGYSFLLSPRALLSITTGVGLTENSPDYTLGVSLPIRFEF